MRYPHAILGAVATLLIGALLTIQGTSLPIYLVAGLGSEFLLFGSALRLNKRRAPDFDIVVAAEIIVAFGVLTLILGLIAAAWAVLDSVPAGVELRLDTIARLVWPFGEGLICAAVAPILATSLRFIDSARLAATTAHAPDAAAELERELRRVIATLAAFATACERSQAVFERSATSFNLSTDVWEKASTAVRAQADLLGGSLTLASDRIQSASRSTDTFAASFGSIGDVSRGAADSLQKLRRSADEGALLLDALARTIASVERFVRPDRAGPP